MGIEYSPEDKFKLKSDQPSSHQRTIISV